MDEVAKIAAPLVAQEAVKLGKKLFKAEEKKEDKPKPVRNADKPKQRPNTTTAPRSGNGPIRNPSKGTIAVPSRLLVSNPRTFLKRKLRAYKGGDSVIIEGCDLAGSFSVDTPAFMELLSFPISPLSLPNTRISIEAQLWQKFQFQYVELIYIPQQGTSTNGSVMLSSVQDPEQGLPKMGTLPFAQALGAVKGAEITQVFVEAHHIVEPPKTDKKEYYVYPDQDGEDRLTVQGVLKLITMSALTINPLCMIYIKYKVRFYERILSPPSIANSGIAWTYAVTSNGSAANNTTMKLTDNGVLSSMQVSFAAGETQVVVGTVYGLLFNFDRGGIEPMQYYYFKMAALGTPVDLRMTASDASSAVGERVNGSWFSSGDLPTNAQALILIASAMPQPGSKKKGVLVGMEEQVAKQAVLIDRLTAQMEEFKDKLDETTYREVRQIPTLFGGRNNTKGV